MDAIILDFIRNFISKCVDESPQMRQRITFYRSFLRNYEEMTDTMLHSRGLADSYKSLDTAKKNELLLEMNQNILDGVNHKYLLKQQLLDSGVSYNELHMPNIDQMVSNYATNSNSKMNN